jgi:mono/diheme cytochrome c family protein
MRIRLRVALLTLPVILLSPAPAFAAERSELWKANCAKCHGEDGRSRTEEGKKKGARDLTKAAWQKSVSDDRFARSITRGRDKMPSFSAVLSPEQVKELVKEVRSLAAAE